MPETTPKTLPSRRTIVKGAAWAAPVIAVAVATPAAAASTVNPSEELDFFITAGEVIGTGSSNGSIRSNGVRLSPSDPANPKTVPAGTTFTITFEYTGPNPAFNFRDTPYGVDWMKDQNQGWAIDATSTKLVFTTTTTVATPEPTGRSMQWALDPAVRPEDRSIVFSGVAVIPEGGDFPNGGTIPNLIVDPNGGTGALSGPTSETWPTE